ncbi:hypothetical protein SLEP1_g6781 [Rubroshorea leprosula]|uniref:Protein kinase domain-containing protein n=1 Tax=Rubroshorea leprosula TaxID=152421 RepID=A0AAV5HWB0_9ROSI|nr:hypothetical protein SLEP1_g6781 [Rubroshorea leprosula]
MEGQQVTVKIWDGVNKKNRRNYGTLGTQNELRLRAELILLKHRKLLSLPYLVNVIGYCHENEHFSVVYDLKPLNSMHNLLLNDTFTWSKRIKAALGLAYLLKFLHTPDPPNEKYLVCNIAAPHIMLDQEYNPKLFDFGMFRGGIFSNWWYNYPSKNDECFGYADPATIGGGISAQQVYLFYCVCIYL